MWRISKVIYKSFLIIILFIIYSCNNFNNNINSLIQNGDNAFNEEKYYKAIDFYNEAILIDSTYNNVFFKRALSKINIEDYKGCINDITIAVNITPSADAYELKGYAYELLENNTEAIFYYNKALSLDSTLLKSNNNIGTLKLQLGDIEGAIIDFNRGLKFNKNSFYLYNNRGLAYSEIEKHEEAIIDYDKSIEINPLVYETYFNRGVSYVYLKNYKQAIVDFNKSIELCKNTVESKIYHNRAVALYMLNDKIKACEDWKIAVDLGNDDAKYYFEKLCITPSP
jgi:tetratricopeptide (TPR) repeat protein